MSDKELATEEELQAEIERRAEAREKEYEEDILWLMSSERGRRIMCKIAERGKLFQTSFRPNSEMQFLEGHRNMALMFQNDLMELDLFDKWALMLKENHERGKYDNLIK